MKAKIFLLMPIVTMVFLISCDQEMNDVAEGKASLNVKLTDAPADYDAVLVDVQDVSIRYHGDDTNWVRLDDVEIGTYNLLELTGGADTLIASSEVDTGMISEIRLKLGNNNFLVINGDSIPLSTPSAQQSGLKIKINEKLSEGLSYELMLDFDAAKSVVKAGNSGKYNLKPVIRAFFEAQDGGISGSVADSVKAVVYTIHETDSIGTYTDSQGEFLIQGLQAGDYSVKIAPDTIFKDTTIHNVTVETGSITSLGFIELNQMMP